MNRMETPSRRAASLIETVFAVIFTEFLLAELLPPVVLPLVLLFP